MSRKKKGPAPGTLYKNVKRTSLGTSIAELRRERGLTQQVLANKTNLTKRMISYYERESETIPSNHMQKIAEALNVQVDELINHTSSPTILEINRGFLKRLELAKTLTLKDQKIISDMIDSLASKTPTPKTK
jgi:transcriptional regulator with XRE-family HTH domain